MRSSSSGSRSATMSVIVTSTASRVPMGAGHAGSCATSVVAFDLTRSLVSSTIAGTVVPYREMATEPSGTQGIDGVEHLAQEDTAHFVGVTDGVGRRVPFELAANGKCFLTFGGAGHAQSQEIRAHGYATSIDELEVGLTAMAAPVLGANGVAIAALSISGPTTRLKSRIDELAEQLKAEANSLSLQLRGAA